MSGKKAELAQRLSERRFALDPSFIDGMNKSEYELQGYTCYPMKGGISALDHAKGLSLVQAEQIEEDQVNQAKYLSNLQYDVEESVRRSAGGVSSFLDGEDLLGHFRG